MYKKCNKVFMFVFFLVVLFLGTFSVSAKEIIKLRECEYTDEYKKYIKLSDKEKKNVIMPQMCKVNLLTSLSLGNSLGNVNSSSFDLRKLNKVTSVKNQESTNLCWAFSTNASIESNLLVNNLGEYDLSESHMDLSNQNTYKLNYNSYNRAFSAGGNSYISSSYVMNHRGPVLEEEIPFSVTKDLISNNSKSYDTTNITNKKAKINVDDVAFIVSNEPCSKNALSTLNIKKYLVNYGAVTSTMYFENITEYSMNNDKYVAISNSMFGPYYYYNGDKNSNHAITIVGWDDNISKDNFKEGNRPSEDGAWIVKNSYGTSNIYNIDNKKYEILSGDNGYYYISYEDTNVCKLASGFYNTSKNVEDNVYYYDELGFNNYLIYNYDLYVGNVFKKKSSKVEKLSKVSFFNYQVGAEYKVYYDKVGNFKNPIEIASGVTDHIGYISVKPNKEILIDDDKYGIIVKYGAVNGTSILPITTKTNTNDYFSTVEITKNVTYISKSISNESSWADLSEIKVQNGVVNSNSTVKAYTNNVETLNTTTTTTKKVNTTTTTKNTSKEEDKKDDDKINDDVDAIIVPNENNDGKSYISNTEKNPSTSEINVVFITIMSIFLMVIILFSIKKLKEIRD